MTRAAFFERVKPAPAVAGLLIFCAILFLPTSLQDVGAFGDRPARAAAVTALMAFWWLTEAVPIQLTACVPLVLFPALGVFGGGLGNEVSTTIGPYLDPYIFLFLGGMCIAAAMQQWNLHRRIAVRIMILIGTDPRRLLLGVLCGTAFVSLWISNTATAAMMVPIALAVVSELELRQGLGKLHAYGASLLLAVAYGANVGGIGTKIGTAPNAQFSQFADQSLGLDISFLQFSAVGFPFVLLFLPLTWWVLWRAGRKDAPAPEVGAAVVAEQAALLGHMRRGERVVLIAFASTAALWILGKPLHGALVPAFAQAGIKLLPAHVEGGIAMLAAVLLMMIRVQGEMALRWRSLRFVPWDTLVLLGGAFAMARGVQDSGLSTWVGGQLTGLSAMTPLAQIVVACLATVALTAVASNMATTGIMLVVLKDAVPASNVVTVLFASTISASLDFALPAGTPPNAIVFGTGRVSVAQMMKTGVALDVLGALLAALFCWLMVPLVFG